jgi:hypothetical protein
MNHVYYLDSNLPICKDRGRGLKDKFVAFEAKDDELPCSPCSQFLNIYLSEMNVLDHLAIERSRKLDYLKALSCYFMMVAVLMVTILVVISVT